MNEKRTGKAGKRRRKKALTGNQKAGADSKHTRLTYYHILTTHRKKKKRKKEE